MVEGPFEHALILAWSDGAFNDESFRALDELQNRLGLSATERAEIEERFESKGPGSADPEAREWGTGEGREALLVWIADLDALLRNRTNAEATARALGRAALDAGLTRSGWRDASIWMAGLGLERAFAEGCWMEGEEIVSLVTIPAALTAVAEILGI